MNNRYDILHFSGHCHFDPEDPTNECGWLFHRDSPREFISARELSRVDRVPKFVFSNACESGILPDRSEARYVGLGPSFAESFFNQGVTNFICTAWTVDDTAAAIFAQKFYAELLGLDLEEDRPVRRRKPEYISTALREARREIARAPEFARSWGAYQHYGDPFYTVFARTAWEDDSD
jgi:CHAT domain-containing protein